METIPSLLISKIRQALGDDSVPIHVTPAGDSRFGDYQTPVAMHMAKQRRVNPRALAQEIASRITMEPMGPPPEIAGAGFINFRLDPSWLAARTAVLAADARLGCPPLAPRTLVVDFSSPNVAKSMHVGHIRSTILGDCLCRIGRFLGHRVIADNHIGDWGTQFGILLVGWKTLLNRDALAKEPIAELERIYKTVSAQCDPDKPGYDPALRAQAKQELVKLQGGDPENLASWQDMIRLSQVQFDALYARLGVRFDHTHGESFYNPALKGVVEDLLQRGVARESQGAVCVFSDHSVPEKDDPFLIQRDGQWVDVPAIVQKADGAANYMTTDLATLDYRLREFSPDDIVYVTDGRQQQHFRQLFTVFRRWRPEAAGRVTLSHVWFGSILGEDNKPFKTRSGETVKLADLLDEAVERADRLIAERNSELGAAERATTARIIGLGAVKYADLSPNRQGDYVFNWDKMLSFHGNTAPYLQYSYVRIQSIFRKAAESGRPVEPPSADQPLTLTEEAEILLAKRLNQFGEILPGVLVDYKPSNVATYLFDLAGCFHNFFESCPVLKSDEPVRSSRLALCHLTGRLLREGLGMLGIEVPERM
ncbi:MAG: arginine--tRNA ligase [Nitrospira sp.]|nr:arginine--tRNA ligase [Nitrospira sp.]